MKPSKVVVLSEDGSKKSRISPFMARKLIDANIAKIVTKDPFTIQVISDLAYTNYKEFLKNRGE